MAHERWIADYFNPQTNSTFIASGEGEKVPLIMGLSMLVPGSQRVIGSIKPRWRCRAHYLNRCGQPYTVSVRGEGPKQIPLTHDGNPLVRGTELFEDLDDNGNVVVQRLN